MHQTCKSSLIKEDLFDEKFAREQTSSNNVKRDFFFFSKFFEITVHLKCIKHFLNHASLIMFDKVFDAFALALRMNLFYEFFYESIQFEIVKRQIY